MRRACGWLGTLAALGLAFAPVAVPGSPLGGGTLYAGGGHADAARGSYAGSERFAGVSVPLESWYSLGAEVALYRFCGPRGFAAIPEATFTFGKSRIVTASLVSRVDLPPHASFGLFATAETGWAWERWGDVHIRNEFFGPRDTFIPGARREGLFAAVGVGLATRWTRPWPRLEAGLRYAALTGPDETKLSTMRVAVRY